MQRSSQEILEAVQDALWDMTVSDLRSLAEDHDIDIEGLRAKGDLVDAIALHPGIAKILGVDAALSEPDAEPSEELPEESEEDWEEAPEEVPQEEPSEPEEAEAPREGAPTPTELDAFAGVKDRLKEALRTQVDFSEPQDLLAEAAQRFKARSYDACVTQARDAVSRVQERVREYTRANWAFAIAAAHRIWEHAHQSSPAAQEAKDRLEEAIGRFQDDAFLGAMDTLQALSDAALNLYGHEMDQARKHVASQEAELRDIEAMGGDTAAATTVLEKASGALETNNWFDYLGLVREADALVKRARMERIDEIREAADNVEAIIAEARDIGADVDEAADLLTQVRSALEREDFVTAHERVGQSERTALEAQKAHMDRVTQMRDQQVEKVRDLIGQIRPLLDEAKSKGFDAQEAAEQLKAAAEHAKAGDYVNALLQAKAAYRAVKSFRAQMEAQKLEQTPLSTDDEEPLPVEPEPEEAEAAEEEEEGGVTCPDCGSSQVEVGFRGKARCENCGAKFRT